MASIRREWNGESTKMGRESERQVAGGSGDGGEGDEEWNVAEAFAILSLICPYDK